MIFTKIVYYVFENKDGLYKFLSKIPYKKAMSRENKWSVLDF